MASSGLPSNNWASGAHGGGATIFVISSEVHQPSGFPCCVGQCSEYPASPWSSRFYHYWPAVLTGGPGTSRFDSDELAGVLGRLSLLFGRDLDSITAASGSQSGFRLGSKSHLKRRVKKAAGCSRNLGKQTPQCDKVLYRTYSHECRRRNSSAPEAPCRNADKRVVLGPAAAVTRHLNIRRARLLVGQV